MAELPVDHGWAWFVAFGVLISFCWTNGNTRLMGLFFIEMSKLFGASSTSTSFVFLFYFGAFTVTALLHGLLADRFSDRQLCIVGCLLQTLATIIQIFSPNIYVFTVTYGCLSGAGFGLCYISGCVILGRYFKEKLAWVSGVVFAGSSVAVLSYPLLGNYLLEVYHIRNVFLICAGCILHILPGAMLFRPPSFYNRASQVKAKTSSNQKNATVLKPSEKQQNIPGQETSEVQQRAHKSQRQDVVTMATSQRMSNAHVELVIQPDDTDVTLSSLRYFADVSPFVYAEASSFWATKQPGILHPAKSTLITFGKACSLLCCCFHFNVLSICRMAMAGMFYIFAFFAPPFTYARGFSVSQISVMMTMVGTLDLYTKLLHGWVASMKNVNATLYSGMMSLCGCMICVIASLVPGSIATYVFNISGGLFLTQNLSLGIQVWKDNVGGKLFPATFNIATMLSGIYTIAMSLLAGWLGDLLHNYDIAMMSVFSTGALASLISVLQWWYMRWNKTPIVDLLEEKLARLN